MGRSCYCWWLFQSVCRRDAVSHSLVLMLSQPPVEERIFFFSLCSCYGGKKCVKKCALLPACLLAVPRSCWEGWKREICLRRGDAKQSVLGACDSPLPCRCCLFPTEEFSRKQKYIIKYFPLRLKLHLCSVFALQTSHQIPLASRVGPLLTGIEQLYGYQCWWFRWYWWCHSESPSKGHLPFPCDKLLGA